MRLNRKTQPCQANEIARLMARASDYAAGRHDNYQLVGDARLDRLEALHAHRRMAENMMRDYFAWLADQVIQAKPEEL